MKKITSIEQLRQWEEEQQKAKQPTESDKAKADYYKAKAEAERAKAERTRAKAKQQSSGDAHFWRMTLLSIGLLGLYLLTILILLLNI